MKTKRLMKWGFVIPTGEYNGGVIGGMGFGVLVATAILSPDHRITNPLVWIGCFGCVVVGSLLARAAQRKRFQNEVTDQKADA